MKKFLDWGVSQEPRNLEKVIEYFSGMWVAPYSANHFFFFEQFTLLVYNVLAEFFGGFVILLEALCYKET